MILFVFYFTVGLFVVYSLFAFFEKAYAKKKLSPVSGERENLEFRKEEILSAINDLEYDFEMKKITEADYLQLKEKLTREAVQVMKKLDDAGAGTGKNERISKRSEKLGS
jgi:hypothetical protein